MARVYWSRVAQRLFLVDYERKIVTIVSYRYDRGSNRLVPAEKRELPLEQGLQELEDAKRATERQLFGHEGYLEEIDTLVRKLPR